MISDNFNFPTITLHLQFPLYTEITKFVLSRQTLLQRLGYNPLHKMSYLPNKCMLWCTKNNTYD